MEQLKRQICHILGENVACRITNGGAKIQYNINGQSATVDIAIMLHKSLSLAIIWDVHHRRKLGGTAHCLSLSEEWEEILPDYQDISVFYKTFKTPSGLCYEKILVMSIDLLRQERSNIQDFLAFDDEDVEYPQHLAKYPQKVLLTRQPRERITTSRWKRIQQFRKKVLARYSNQCAICRCREEKLLQAAHIVAVSDGGSDDVENGICLCANHHIMLDNGLISIDYAKGTLTTVAASVQRMPWYNVFLKEHQSRLLLPGDD